MGIYYKSKEVYKQHRDLQGVSKIIPVRGLYVSGEHYEAMYIDHAITVDQFTSSPFTIVDYTTISTSQTDHSVNLIDVTGNVTASLERYTSSTIPNQTDHSVNLIHVDGSVDVTLDRYTTDNVPNQTDHSVNLIHVDGSISYDIESYAINKGTFGHDGVVSVLSFDATSLSISRPMLTALDSL